MSKLVVYVDGSEREKRVGTKVKNVYGGFGFVAHHNGDTDEVFGAFDVVSNQRGFHELVAFTKAVLYAEEHGYTPEEVSFYTDYLFLAESTFHLYPGNRSLSKVNYLNRLRLLKKHYFPNEKGLVLKLATWLVNSRVTWVKSHANTVDNCRADVLARAGTRLAKEKQSLSTVNDWTYVDPITRWLHMERKVYTQRGVVTRYLPFCGTAA